MHAVVFHQFGEPADVLGVQDVPEPEPGPGEVRVRMLASPINPSDLMTVRGTYGRHKEEHPGGSDTPNKSGDVSTSRGAGMTPGFEGVGIVEEAGGGLLGKLRVGKRVAVLNRGGGNWAEQVVVPAMQVIPVPQDIPVEQAAMFFVNPATAYAMTRRVLRVPGDAWLLQTAAGSALGRMVIRLGRRFGFRTLNVLRRDKQAGELRELGGDAVVVFDPDRHEPQQLENDVRRITDGRGVRYAIDPVGGRTASALVGCLAGGGRLLLYGTLSKEPLSFSPRVLMGTGARIEGFWLAGWIERQGLVGRLRLVKSISGLMRKGILVSPIERTYRLEEITEAAREAERPGRTEKVLLRISVP